jgi:hypothetical protein
MNGEIEKGMRVVIQAPGYMAGFLQSGRIGKSKE